MEYLITLPIENFRLFCCIANSLEDGCLPCIGTANDEDAKTRADSKILRSSLLSFYILYSVGFNIRKRHLSLRCLRWWKWWRIKISAVGSVLFGYAGQSQEWHHWLTCDLASDYVSMHALDLNLVQLPSAQMEFAIYSHVIGSPTKLFKPQSAHDDPHTAQSGH